MDTLSKQKSCELHVHVGGCYTAEDVLELARDVYRDVDWGMYVDSYEKAYGEKVDVVGMIDGALGGGEDETEAFSKHYIVGGCDAGDFMKFQAKFNLFICLYRHYAIKLDGEQWLQRWFVERLAARYREEGVSYVEMRAYYGRTSVVDDAEGFVAFHKMNAQVLSEAGIDGFEVKYVPSLDRKNPLLCYNLIQELLMEQPELGDVIVGFDFCFIEEGYPPCGESMKRFFQVLAIDNARRRRGKLGVVYHVGESFYDKSLESAVRWCHQAAIYGAKRLGHAIALGLDPAVAIGRRDGGHEEELVSERLDQIDYDLQFVEDMEEAGILVDVKKLRREKRELEKLDKDAIVRRIYDEERLEEVRKRQVFVLDDLERMGTVIESCPTSNLLIGGVPSEADHPIHRFLESGVNLVVCADDPGIFGCTLGSEVDWVLEHGGMGEEELSKRLGDPMGYRLG